MLYLTLRQYHFVVAIADAGSLTAAAVALNVSQPSLSVAVTRVEARLGRQIFIRGKGAAIVVTPFGHQFVAQARGLLHDAKTIETGPDAENLLTLGCFEDIAPWYLPKALADLSGQFPHMRFVGREGRFADLAAGMREGRIDLAISYDIGFDGPFDRLRLRRVGPVAFMCPAHPLASLPEIELHQLAEHPLILSREDLSLGFIKGLFDRLNVTPVVAHTTASLEMMRSLSAHDAGIGISYSNPPTPQSYDGQPLVTVPIRTQEALADIVLVWPTIAAPEPRTITIVHAIQAML